MNDCCKKTMRDSDEKSKLLKRIAIINGQLNGIYKMIEDDRYCNDILIQLSAVEKSIKSLASVVLESHMHSCVKKAIEEGSVEIIDELLDTFRRFS